MRNLRWWLFKLISRFGWWVCPEPDKTALGYIWQTGMTDTLAKLPREEAPEG